MVTNDIQKEYLDILKSKFGSSKTANLSSKKSSKTSKNSNTKIDLLSSTLTNGNSTVANKTILNCDSCQTNYTSFILDGEAKCLNFGETQHLSLAVSTCAKDGARPPLPKTEQESADLLIYFYSKRSKKQADFAIDLSDVKTEGEFISSRGKKVNFTKWHKNEPDDKDGTQDFVTMEKYGTWKDTEGNYSTVIICQTDCPLSKF